MKQSIQRNWFDRNGIHTDISTKIHMCIGGYGVLSKISLIHQRHYQAYRERETDVIQPREPIHHFFLLCEHQWKWQTVPQTQQNYKANKKKRGKIEIRRHDFIIQLIETYSFYFLVFELKSQFYLSYKSVRTFRSESFALWVCFVIVQKQRREFFFKFNEQKQKDKNWTQSVK